MKYLKNVAFMLVFVAALLSCSTPNSNKQSTITKETNSDDISGGQINVYYFHTNYRCNTCRTVEHLTKENLKSLYPEAFKNGMVAYHVINIKNEEFQDLVKRYEIAGQTLLFVCNDKAIDKTTEAFMNATTNPDKWKSIVKKTVEELLNN